jgi:hypothetical protein
MGTVEIVAFILLAWTSTTRTNAAFQTPATVTSVAIPADRRVLANSLACQAVLSAFIVPEPKSKQLQATASLGSQRLAIEFGGSIMKLITTTSVNSGNATAAEFQVLRDDEENLVAILHDRGTLGSTLNSFVLNKRNGLAVWTKARPFFLFDPQPDMQAFYLQCR